MAKGTIKVVADRCKSCGYCIKFCPKGVLAIGKNVNAKGYEYVEPVNADDCIACAICGRICPDGAIEVYKN
ncbi:MAG: 4Fe-4S dicluster domain-containing protein [Lachnospiraceae bacterium]|nr:4Fe-4S dicluster domain-containing protein [Lachnospiraceae bacterium]